MNDIPFLECTSGDVDKVAEVAAIAYLNPHGLSSAAAKARRRDVRAKQRIKRATPIILKAMEGVNYAPWPTPGEVLQAEQKAKEACRAGLGPIQMWLLSTLLQWLIPVLVRWWFSTRSQDMRMAAARRSR